MLPFYREIEEVGFVSLPTQNKACYTNFREDIKEVSQLNALTREDKETFENIDTLICVPLKNA